MYKNEATKSKHISGHFQKHYIHMPQPKHQLVGKAVLYHITSAQLPLKLDLCFKRNFSASFQ